MLLLTPASCTNVLSVLAPLSYVWFLVLFKAGFVWFSFASAISYFSFKISVFLVRFFIQCLFKNFIINSMEFPNN